MKNVTLSADEDLLEQARLVARFQHKTLNSPCLKWPRRSRADFRLFSGVPTPSTARPQRVVATLWRLEFDKPFAKMKIGF